MPRLILTQAPQLLAHFRQVNQTVCWAWAIKPERGPWEGYTSFDVNLHLPAYTVAANLSHPALGGNPDDIPAMTYLCAGGVAPTSIPVSLNLGKDGTDVAILAFDRGRLLTGYYQGAKFEAFVLNYEDPNMGRDVRISGKIGNARVTDISATVELIPWPALAAAAIGRVCTPVCDVGCYPGEKFGTGRCRNITLQDGVLRNDWGVLAEVSGIDGRTALELSFGGVALSGNALPGTFPARLPEGDIEFLAAPYGGQNSLVERRIKAAETVSAGVVNVQLHEAAPLTVEVGDQLNLFAGCKRDAAACKAFGNFNNFQGFPHVPGKAGVVRRYTG